MKKKSKFSNNPNDIPKSAKNSYEKLGTKETTSKAAIPELFSEVSNRKKMSNNQFHHYEMKHFLEKVTKSINSHILNKY